MQYAFADVVSEDDVAAVKTRPSPYCDGGSVGNAKLTNDDIVQVEDDGIPSEIHGRSIGGADDAVAVAVDSERTR